MNQVNGIGGYLGGLAYRPREDGRPDAASGAFDELVSGSRETVQLEPAAVVAGTVPQPGEAPLESRAQSPVLVTYDWTGTLRTTELVSGSNVNIVY